MNDPRLPSAKPSGYGSLICPACGAESTLLHVDGAIEHMECEGCHVEYPVLNGVPLLMKPDQYDRMAGQISEKIGKTYAERDVLLALGSALAYVPQGASLSEEFGNLLGRFRLNERTGFEGMAERVSLVNEMMPGTLVAGQTTYRTLRIRNGFPTKYMATIGSQPFHVSYHMYNRHGDVVVFDGPRTRFPVPLKPGAELSVPVTIHAPEQPGTYRFTFHVVEETVQWHDAFFEVTLDVVKPAKRVAAKPGLQGDFVYDADVAAVGETLARAVQLTGKSEIDALELACGLHPQILLHRVPARRAVCMDLCFPELQLANIFYREANRPQNFTFVSADCMAPPVTDASFDLAVICAALHHFADPVGLLKAVKRKLRDGGFVAVVREPCFVNPEDPNYIAELQRGFNEQQFTLEEFDEIFDRAGFDVIEERIDFGGSLKVILSPKHA